MFCQSYLATILGLKVQAFLTGYELYHSLPSFYSPGNLKILLT